MKNNWIYSQNNYFISEVSQQIEKLPKAIYTLEYDDMKGIFFLSQTQEKFSFPYKIYGNETDFINYVCKTWDHTKSNMGILLNGVKGTGKTVTAELICNQVNLPVIIVDKKFNGSINNFVNEIQQDVIFFFDEYEKNYDEDNHTVLTVMDGVMNNSHRKLFVLTTNTLWINENLIDRPGRIRYLKTFKDLKKDAVIEIVDDLLKYPEYRNDIIDFVSKLALITVDIVKTIVNDVNIHNVKPEYFKDFINAKQSDDVYNIYEIAKNNKSKLVAENCKINVKPSDWEEGNYFRGNGKDFGQIEEIIGEDTIIVETESWKGDKCIRKKIKLKIEKGTKTHYNFLF